ncbi:MAG: hypothetical protein ACFFG0_08090 [Candidatus Thorarchaeota archaeon]
MSDIEDLLPTISKNEIRELVNNWLNITKEEQEEMKEIGDSYKERYIQLMGRINELVKEFKKLLEK